MLKANQFLTTGVQNETFWNGNTQTIRSTSLTLMAC